MSRHTLDRGIQIRYTEKFHRRSSYSDKTISVGQVVDFTILQRAGVISRPVLNSRIGPVHQVTKILVNILIERFSRTRRPLSTN